MDCNAVEILVAGLILTMAISGMFAIIISVIWRSDPGGS